MLACCVVIMFGLWVYNIFLCLVGCPQRITILPNGVLQIQKVQFEDAGKYRCVATNIGGRLKSRAASLTINRGM